MIFRPNKSYDRNTWFTDDINLDERLEGLANTCQEKSILPFVVITRESRKGEKWCVPAYSKHLVRITNRPHHTYDTVASVPFYGVLEHSTADEIRQAIFEIVDKQLEVQTVA